LEKKGGIERRSNFQWKEKAGLMEIGIFKGKKGKGRKFHRKDVWCKLDDESSVMGRGELHRI
jgi:hypothetical protein